MKRASIEASARNPAPEAWRRVFLPGTATVKFCVLPGLKIETWGARVHGHDYEITRSRY